MEIVKWVGAGLGILVGLAGVVMWLSLVKFWGRR